MVKFYAQAFQSIGMRSKPEEIASRAVPLYYNSYMCSYGTDV